MAQTYTLEEAADKLNLSVEEFKRRLRTEWTQIRSFRDGSTLRFRANEVDELARSYGLGSSDELPLSEGSGQDIPSQPPAAPTTADDTFALAPGGSSGRHKAAGKPDSDVRLEKASDVKKPPADDESILTEEFEVPAAGGSGKLSGRSGKLSATQLKTDSGKHKAEGGDSGKLKSGSSGKQTPTGSSAKHKKPDDSSSEFELSLDPDSDEFELSLAPDSSEEVALGEMPPEAGSGSKKTGSSGINLNRPTDSGVSLEKKKKDDEEVDFELSLDAPGSGASAKKLSSGKLKADSDSEFELTLEEPSDGGLNAAAAAEAEKKGDIFEATDFEIPALEDDSASEAVSLDEADTDLESSDFDLALDESDASAEEESASEVVALDEGGKARKKPKRRPVVDDEAVDLSDPDLEEGPSASSALRGVRPDEEEEDYEVSEAADDEGRSLVVAGPTSWGPIPAIFMFPTVLVMFLGTLMAFELLHSTWGYQQANKPTTPLVDFFADKFGAKPAQ
jgi:hypothetical protein